MAIDYQAPGVTIKEYTDASIAPLLATPDSICLIGPTPGPIQTSQTVILSDADNATGTGTTTNNTKTVTGVTQSTGTFVVGQIITGTNIPASTTIVAITGVSPNLTLTLSNNATGSGSVNNLASSGTVLLDPNVGTLAVSPAPVVRAADPNQVNTASNAYDPSVGYTTNSYTIVNNAIVRKDPATGNYSQIDSGDIVTVTYYYTPADYWQPRRFDNMSDIEARYGTAYDADQKKINSPVSLAAQLAFENGASDLIIQPVFYNNSGTPQQPTNTQLTTDIANTWAKSLESLRAIDNIGMIVPVIGQSSSYSIDGTAGVTLNDTTQLNILKAVQSHIWYQYTNNDQMIIGIFGEDGTDTTTTYAAQATLQSHATNIRSAYNNAVSQQIVLVSPAKFRRVSPLGNIINLGGQYAAAAIAGMLASRAVSASLTRKNVIGFSEIYDTRTKQQKNDDSKNGLFVIEQKGLLVQIRHALTTDVSTVAKSELSVVRAKQKMITSLYKTIDEQIVGTVVADNNAPLVIASAIGGTLNQMVGDGDIVGFSDVQSRTVTINPTVVEVRFNYRPAFPVNYIQIGFSVDLTSGTLNIGTTANQVNTGA